MMYIPIGLKHNPSSLEKGSHVLFRTWNGRHFVLRIGIVVLENGWKIQDVNTKEIHHVNSGDVFMIGPDHPVKRVMAKLDMV